MAIVGEYTSVGGSKLGGTSGISRRFSPSVSGGVNFGGIFTTLKRKGWNVTGTGALVIDGGDKPLVPGYAEFNGNTPSILYRSVPSTTTSLGNAAVFDYTFEGDSSTWGQFLKYEYLTPGAIGDDPTKLTLAFRFKCSTINLENRHDFPIFRLYGDYSKYDFAASDILLVYFYYWSNSNSYSIEVLCDNGDGAFDAWNDPPFDQIDFNPNTVYTLVVQIDTSLPTSTDRLKVYLNNTLVTLDPTCNFPVQNQRLYDVGPNINYSRAEIGGFVQYWIDNPFHGEMLNAYFIDGYIVAPSSIFPSGYNGPFGSAGFKLDFSALDSIGYDFSGNNHTFVDMYAEDPYNFYEIFQRPAYDYDITIDKTKFVFYTEIYISSSTSIYWDSIVCIRNGLEQQGETSLYFNGSTTGLNFSASDPYGNWLIDVYTVDTISRDTWIPICLYYDSGQAQDYDRVKIFIDDVQATLDTGISTLPSLGQEWDGAAFGKGERFFTLGGYKYYPFTQYSLTGNLRNTIFIDGLLVDRSSITRDYMSPVGRSGWHLLYESTPVGKDSTVNALDFTAENVAQYFGYNSSSSIGFSIVFELLVSDTPIRSFSLPLTLYSGDPITSSFTLELAPIATVKIYTYVSAGGVYTSAAAGTNSSSSSVPPLSGQAKWIAKCYINNVDVSSSLTGDITIENEEDSSAIAQFTIIPSPGVVDPLLYIGKTVELWWGQVNYSGVLVFIKRRFMGSVSNIEWDTDRRIITLVADTQMPAYFNDLTKEEIAATVGGLWSDKVWDNEDDATGWTHAQERLSTTENCVWHDANWQLQITDIKARRSGGIIIPDYIFTDNERFHETLKLEYAQRSEMVNNIRINISYSYDRKRERQIYFSWKSHNAEYLSGFVCGIYPTDGSYQLCQRSMVESAASSGDWVAISEITYDDIWPAQIVNCGAGIWDIVVWGMGVTTIFSPDPEKPKEYALNVSTGKKVYDRQVAYEQPTSPEITKALCIGARWKAARRWVQNVEEIYDVIVKAPDSIEVIGEVTSTEEYSLEHKEEDISNWEGSLTSTCTEDTSASKVMPGSLDLYLDADEYAASGTFNRDEFNEAQEVILAAAKGDIIRAHRLTTVSFQVAYNPDITLAHTIKVDTPYLVAEGKVKAIRDVWGIDTGEASTEITVAISRHNGSGLYTETDPLFAADKPVPTTEASISGRYQLNNYIGGRVYNNVGFTGKFDSCKVEEERWEGFLTNFESPLLRGEYADWMGAIGTAFADYESAYYQQYMEVAPYIIPYQFTVRGPVIDEEYVNAILANNSAVYNVAIPQDTLQLFA
jgi:hypothetical protein